MLRDTDAQMNERHAKNGILECQKQLILFSSNKGETTLKIKTRLIV